MASTIIVNMRHMVCVSPGATTEDLIEDYFEM